MKDDRFDPPITRRRFARTALGAAAAIALGRTLDAPAALAAHHEAAEGGEAPKLVNDFPENELLLSQVKYVAVSEIEGKQCANCALLVQRDGEYGKCGLFQKGQVPVEAYCTSWIKKPGT